MKRECRNATMIFGAALFFALKTAIIPASAQQVDLNAIQRRFHQLYEAGNYPAALEEAKKLEAGAKARLGTDDGNYGITLYNLALAYAALGKYAEAEQHYREALAIQEKLYGSGDRKLLRSINNLAIVNMRQGKYAEAEALYKRAQAILIKELGEAHAEVGFNLDNLGLIYADQGRYAEAEAMVTGPKPKPSSGARSRFTRKPSAQSTPAWPHCSSTLQIPTSRTGAPTPSSYCSAPSPSKRKCLGRSILSWPTQSTIWGIFTSARANMPRPKPCSGARLPSTRSCSEEIIQAPPQYSTTSPSSPAAAAIARMRSPIRARQQPP